MLRVISWTRAQNVQLGLVDWIVTKKTRLAPMSKSHGQKIPCISQVPSKRIFFGKHCTGIVRLGWQSLSSVDAMYVDESASRSFLATVIDAMYVDDSASCSFLARVIYTMYVDESASRSFLATVIDTNWMPNLENLAMKFCVLQFRHGNMIDTLTCGSTLSLSIEDKHSTSW